MPDAGGQTCGWALQDKEEAQSVYKEENEKESNREWKQETVSTVDWEQYWSKEREAIQGGGKKLQQKQGSSEKEK